MGIFKSVTGVYPLAAILLFPACGSISTKPMPAPVHVSDAWGAVKTPREGPSESIGTYSAGCLIGGVSLPPDGPGYQVMRITRRRFYGHPDLIRFIRHLGQEAQAKKLGSILVGDLGQPRGGPAPSGHRSHQIGLDVDIWFDRAEGSSLTLDERESKSARSVVDPSRMSMEMGIWNAGDRRILELAAKTPEVERIFVSPAIKRLICSQAKGEAWVSKLRPWWGHQEHFHVRLKCAVGNPRCIPQENVPPGDGCDSTLDWWFSDEAKAKAKSEDEAPPAEPKLPEACDGVLG